MHHIQRAASAVLCVALLALGAPAHAERGDPPPEAVEAARRGRELFEAERYREAIVELQAAYDAFPAASLLHNLGRCYEELESSCEAASYFRRFLREGRPQGEVREDVVRSISVLEDACEEEQAEEPDPDEGGGRDPDEDPLPDPGEGDGSDIDAPARLFDAGSTEPETSVTDVVGITSMVVGGVVAAVGIGLWGWALYELEDDDCLFGSRDYREAPECRVQTREIDLEARVGDGLLWGGGIAFAIGLFVYLAVPQITGGAGSAVSLAPTPGGMALSLALP